MANSQRGSHPESSGTKNRNRFTGTVTGFFAHPETVPCEYLPEKYSYIFRRKSRWELARISAIVSGIELCYAAETAFVVPVLLSLGLNVKYVSMIWCLSPLMAFITTPILGTLSDSCNSKFGRRRPFIFVLSVGIIIGLILVPHGGRFGLLLGDTPDLVNIGTATESAAHSTNLTGNKLPRTRQSPSEEIEMEISNASFPDLAGSKNNSFGVPGGFNDAEMAIPDLATDAEFDSEINARVFGILITAIGAVFLDFCADVCQSPCRAYLLDITTPEEHAAGLAAFALNSGLGASAGYGIAAMKWDIPPLWRNVLEGQVVVVFAIITSLYLLLLGTSSYGFPEIPMPLLGVPSVLKEYQEKMAGRAQNGSKMDVLSKLQLEHPTAKNDKGAKDASGTNRGTSSETRQQNDSVKEGTLPSCPQTSPEENLKSILLVPKSLRVLCLANFFYGMGMMCYTVFFTDFVGQCVFAGDPRAPKDSESYELYEEGVRFGCWGMAFSSLSSAVYSSVVEDLAKHFGAKIIFVCGGLVYSAGMAIVAVTTHKVSSIILSSTAGIMLTTLSTVPFTLVAHYHTSLKFQESIKKDDHCRRGLGTDVATVISVIVLSQCILSLSIGTVVEAVGSNRIVIYSAALFSACGGILATQVMYFEM